MRSVRARLLPGLAWAAFVLLALHVAVGLTPIGWLLGAAFDVVTLVLLVGALERAGTRGPRPADQVTLVRAGLVGGVTALVAGSFVGTSSVGLLVVVSTVALLLDTVDGWVARRTHTQSALGARFDMEVDAFLILVLSAYVARSVGGWVLLIGLARYLLLAAGHPWLWLRRPAPPRYWAKVVAATQGIVLTVVAADVLPRAAAAMLTAAALGLLAESFAQQVRWLWRAHKRLGDPRATPSAGGDSSATATSRRPTVARGLTIAAVVVLWLALALPDQLGRLTAANFVQIPAEGLIVTAVAMVMPARARQALAALVGSGLGLLVLLKVLDMGYYAELGRAFNPVIEWSTLGPAIGVLRSAVGSAWAYAAVVGAALLAVSVIVLSTWASLRVARHSATHRRGTALTLSALAFVWVGSASVGLNVAPQTPVASRATAAFAAAEVRNVAAAAADRAEFGHDLAAADPYRLVPSADLLAGLRGKDVIIAFVESYGQTAVQGSTFAPGIVSVLDDGTQALAAAGFAARSAFLTSPTFGGVSWLAHSTLQSGLWIDNSQRYDSLLSSSRFTLSDAFKNGGWRTVLDGPSDVGDWPEGRGFYHYDELYDSTNTGYRGPRFGYARVPDQYTLEMFRQLELTPGHAPVMAEIDLVSSHTPWTPLPRLIDASQLGDGSIYGPMAEAGPSAAQLFKSSEDLRAAYGRSIQYSLQSLVSFVQTAHDDNLVLVVLGDHQPASRVSGTDATHEVPVSIIAHDPAVLDRVSFWGWQSGLRPAADGPVWRMDAFRNRFFDAFTGVAGS